MVIRHFRVVAWVLAVFAVSGLQFPVSCGAPPAKASHTIDRVFVGYLYGRPDDIRYEMYTHLCHAFIVADGTGKLTPNNHVPDRRLVVDAHAAGVKVLISLGGWGWDAQFAEMTADVSARARYVGAVMQLVDDFDYDGVDLDWEYPDTVDEVGDFARLAKEFRSRLDALGERKKRPMLFTMACSASPESLEWLKTPLLVETMDWINVMTYDYAGQWSKQAAHHAPLFASSKLPGDGAQSIELTMNYLVEKKKIPADKLAVGLPLYGRAFAVAEPYAATAEAREPEFDSLNFPRLDQLRTRDGWQRQWDDETKTPWLVAADGSAVIGYDDADSMAAKTGWAMERGFRGVFFWQIAADRMPDGSNPLQEAAHRIWSEAKTASQKRAVRD